VAKWRNLLRRLNKNIACSVLLIQFMGWDVITWSYDMWWSFTTATCQADWAKQGTGLSCVSRVEREYYVLVWVTY
jgi:hypothetical protein